jgi:hypothetical protein
MSVHLPDYREFMTQFLKMVTLRMLSLQGLTAIKIVLDVGKVRGRISLIVSSIGSTQEINRLIMVLVVDPTTKMPRKRNLVFSG